MAKELDTENQSSCDHTPQGFNNPTVTRTMTIKRTELCEVITNTNFSEDIKLHPPVVPQAKNGKLDPRTFSGDATVIVEPCGLIKKGQKGWLECKGKSDDGSEYTIILMDGELITADEEKNGVSRTLSRDELENYADEAELTFVFRVTTDACCKEGPEVTFPPLKLIYVEVFLDLTTFDNFYWNDWARGPAAYRNVDAEIQNLGGDFCLVHDAISTRAGELVNKQYYNLTVGKRYKFGISVGRRNTYPPVPTLSLIARLPNGSGQITVAGPSSFPSMTFTLLEGTFVATAQHMLLAIVTHNAIGPKDDGDDYNISYIRVESV